MEEQNKEETYLDLLERLGLNEETKKIIIEKIENLHKEVDGKIDNRKKTLDALKSFKFSYFLSIVPVLK